MASNKKATTSSTSNIFLAGGGYESLPEPHARIDEVREGYLTTIVDILNGAENDNQIFDQKYKNADYLLEHYLEYLVALTEINHESRQDCYTKLQNAIVRHKKVDWKQVQRRVFSWATKGYQGDPPKGCVDSNGQVRPVSEEEDPEYMDREVDDTWLDGSEDSGTADAIPLLPDDIKFYQARWEAATPYLKQILEMPTVYKSLSGEARSGIDRLNHELRTQQIHDKSQVDMTIPIQEIMYILIICTEKLAEHLYAKAQNTMECITTKKADLVKQELEVFLTKIQRAGQPESWAAELEAAVNSKADLLARNRSKRDKLSELWEEDFLKSLHVEDDRNDWCEEWRTRSSIGAETCRTMDPIESLTHLRLTHIEALQKTMSNLLVGSLPRATGPRRI